MGRGIGESTDSDCLCRELEREKAWSRIHLVPLLLAEGDRDAYRRQQAALAREREIMKDVKGWEVSLFPHGRVVRSLYLLTTHVSHLHAFALVDAFRWGSPCTTTPSIALRTILWCCNEHSSSIHICARPSRRREQWSHLCTGSAARYVFCLHLSTSASQRRVRMVFANNVNAA